MGIHTMFSDGLYGLTGNLFLDVAPVRVNLVGPWERIMERAAVIAKLRERLPAREIPRLEDVTEAYVYCVKDGGDDGRLYRVMGGTLV